MKPIEVIIRGHKFYVIKDDNSLSVYDSKWRNITIMLRPQAIEFFMNVAING